MRRQGRCQGNAGNAGSLRRADGYVVGRRQGSREDVYPTDYCGDPLWTAKQEDSVECSWGRGWAKRVYGIKPAYCLAPALRCRAYCAKAIQGRRYHGIEKGMGKSSLFRCVPCSPRCGRLCAPSCMPTWPTCGRVWRTSWRRASRRRGRCSRASGTCLHSPSRCQSGSRHEGRSPTFKVVHGAPRAWACARRVGAHPLERVANVS